VLFNSLQFPVFLLAVVLVYWMLQKRAQNTLLLVASYYFYGSWNWKFLGLILLSTIIDYTLSQRLAQTQETARRKRLVLISIVVNLGILATFKYFNFFAGSLYELLMGLGIQTDPLVLNVILPVGISFYTFQTMGYTIDVYRKQTEPCGDPLNFALYVCFFPQLVAGPIERASRLIPQIENPRTFSSAVFQKGIFLIAWGMWKKVVIADNMAVIVDQLFTQEASTGFASLLAGYGFALQIYCDFSGYTDIARGTALLLGFNLCENFNLPYFSQSIQEFWRRWHMSLSAWLRDYLYIPLGGNRKGTRRTYINLMTTMLLGGLWHGAAWTFVIWGGLHGSMLAIERKLGLPMTTSGGNLKKAIRILITFHLVCLTWIVFRADSASNLWMVLEGFGSWARPESEHVVMAVKILVCASMLGFVQIFQHLKRDHLYILQLKWPTRTAYYFAGLYIFLLFANFEVSEFIYFQF
jgi:alginate O-acetyltransferase complex protein AlgI